MKKQDFLYPLGDGHVYASSAGGAQFMEAYVPASMAAGFLDEAAKAREEAAKAQEEAVKLAKFKSFVHAQMDAMGVPKFEDHDCRIVSRLFWLRDLNRLVENAIRNAAQRRLVRMRCRPLWAIVRDMFAVGSTMAAGLCARYGFHSDTGRVLPAPEPKEGV